MRYLFARLDQKRKLLGNFEKILKIFDENSIEKLNFYFIFIFILNFILNFIFRQFVTQNRAFGNNTSFLQQFFRFGGRGNFTPFPPGYALGWNAVIYSVMPQVILPWMVNVCATQIPSVFKNRFPAFRVRRNFERVVGARYIADLLYFLDSQKPKTRRKFSPKTIFNKCW